MESRRNLKNISVTQKFIHAFLYREETWHFTETSSHSNTSKLEFHLGMQHQIQEGVFESSNFCPQSDWKNNEIAEVKLHLNNFMYN
jgi:hypothetical protein